jgi:hypothetical protein
VKNLHYWKANKNLTLIQAAFLILGVDPQDYRNEEIWVTDRLPVGFDAIYQALLGAVNDCDPYPFDGPPTFELPTNEEYPRRGSVEYRDGYFYTVQTKHLKEWLKSHEIESSFFFPESATHLKGADASCELEARQVQCLITGPTFDRLQRAIATFPNRYIEYQTRLPKLDSDVRPWLKEAGLANNDREAHVFGAIIAEHFKLLTDTQKS